MYTSERTPGKLRGEAQELSEIFFIFGCTGYSHRSVVCSNHHPKRTNIVVINKEFVPCSIYATVPMKYDAICIFTHRIRTLIWNLQNSCNQFSVVKQSFPSINQGNVKQDNTDLSPIQYIFLLLITSDNMHCN